MTKGVKQSLAIELLASAGFDRRLIADLLKTTPNTVSVTLSMSKAKARAAGANRKTGGSPQGLG
jgi:DNA-binding CsgD family transcriptional regulator